MLREHNRMIENEKDEMERDHGMGGLISNSMGGLSGVLKLGQTRINPRKIGIWGVPTCLWMGGKDEEKQSREKAKSRRWQIKLMKK